MYFRWQLCTRLECAPSHVFSNLTLLASVDQARYLAMETEACINISLRQPRLGRQPQVTFTLGFTVLCTA